jgi:HSP20 family protein
MHRLSKTVFNNKLPLIARGLSRSAAQYQQAAAAASQTTGSQTTPSKQETSTKGDTEMNVQTTDKTDRGERQLSTRRKRGTDHWFEPFSLDVFARDPFFRPLTTRRLWDTDILSDIDRMIPDIWAPIRATEDLVKTFTPLMDLKEAEDHYAIELEVPGFKKEDIKLSFDPSTRLLTISGKTEVDKEKDKTKGGYKYHRIERKVGSFTRQIQLPEDMDVEQSIDAQYKDGVLNIKVPKGKRQQQSKEIQIQ